MRRLMYWLMEEVASVLPAVIYFCILFNLIFFTTGLTLPAQTPRFYSYFTITLLALVAGKVLLIVNLFPFVNLFPHKPLIYNIPWKFFLYFFFLFILWSLENLLRFSLSYQSFSIAWEIYGKELASPIFWTTLIWTALAFLGFIIFSELTRVIGGQKMKQLFFGSKA